MLLRKQDSTGARITVADIHLDPIEVVLGGEPSYLLDELVAKKLPILLAKMTKSPQVVTPALPDPKRVASRRNRTVSRRRAVRRG